MVCLRGRGLRVEGRDVDLLLPTGALRHLLDAEGRAEVVVVLCRPGTRHPDLKLHLLLQQGQRLIIGLVFLIINLLLLILKDPLTTVNNTELG